MSVVANLADPNEVLDEWHDHERANVVTLHPLRGDLRDRGFLAVARNLEGAIVVERIFLFTAEGLRALTEAEMGALPRADEGWRRLLRRLTSGTAALILAISVVAGCMPAEVSTPLPSGRPDGNCEILTPRVLPSGALPGVMKLEGKSSFSWGAGPDRIVEAVGVFALGDPRTFGVPPASDQWVKIRGADGLIVPLGDEGIGQVVIMWQLADCPYTIWLERGHTIESASDYAASF